MVIQFRKKLILILFPLLLSGCTIFLRTQPKEIEIYDPLIERNRQWQEQIDRGNWALNNQDLQRALEAYQAALVIKPNSSETQLKIGMLYLQRSEYENARDAFVAYLKLDAKNTNVWNYLGYVYEKLNAYSTAARAYERALQIDQRNLYAMNHLGLAYKQLNQLDDAEQILRKALEIDPKCARHESQNLHNYLALIYLERGEVGEAIAEFRESVRLFPKDVWARQQLAALYENRGRYYEAELQYQDILKVDAGNLLAPMRLQALAQFRPARADVDVQPVELISVDTDAIIAQAPGVSDYPDADVLILLNQFSHEMLATGKSRYTTHQVVKLLTERGVQKYDDIAIPYQPTAQNIGVNIARTIRSDGTVVEPSDDAFNDVTPPGLLAYNLYSDMMWKVISMPALEPGACIEYQVTLEDASNRAVGSTTWLWGGFKFQSTEVTLQTNYALRLPKDTKFRWKLINCQLSPSIRHEAESDIYIWKYGETPAIKEEVGMPPLDSVTARLSYSSVKSWDDVYNWYKGLAKDRYTPDEAIEEAVNQLTGDLITDEDKIREIYHFVASQIRYVGIELGRSAYQPSPAAEVLKKRYGDCKDKTTLIISMLQLVGIEAFPVLLSPSPYERIDLELPSVSQFSHIIVAIPRGDLAQQEETDYLWLDATADTCSYGGLPDSDQGRKGFLIGKHHGKFVDIPTFPPESNQLISHTEMRLNTDGSIQGKMRIGTTGQYSLDARLKYKQIHSNNLSETLATELSKQFPGIKVTQAETSDLKDLNLPVEINLSFQVEEYPKPINAVGGRSLSRPVGGKSLSRPVGGKSLSRFLLPLPIDEFAAYAELFAPTERQYPLHLSYPMQMSKEIRITLPEGWTTALPTDLNEEHSFATLSRRYRAEGNEIRYQLHYTLKKPTIAPEDYATAKRFFDRLAREDGAHLILERLKSRT